MISFLDIDDEYRSFGKLPWLTYINHGYTWLTMVNIQNGTKCCLDRNFRKQLQQIFIVFFLIVVFGDGFKKRCVSVPFHPMGFVRGDKGSKLRKTTSLQRKGKPKTNFIPSLKPSFEVRPHMSNSRLLKAVVNDDY